MIKYLFSIIFCCICFNKINAQITFQKQYQQLDSASALQTYDSKPTPDGGYVLTGIASVGNDLMNYHPFIIKLNCKGEIEWQKYFGATQSSANIGARVIVTHDSDYVIINNIGVYTNYNGLVVRLDKLGNIEWQKKISLSSGNDVLSGIIETSTGDLVITGSAKSTPDVALIKLRANGNFVFNKTFGNNGNYDDGYALIETNDGGYLMTGRYISMGTFNSFLLKTDSVGTFSWLKCYGDTNQSMYGYALKEMPNGDILMAGSTSLLKANYQSFSDNYLMRLNNVGDTLWTKIFYGTPDSYENVSSIEFDNLGNIILGVATASYYSPGIVPNKHALMKFSPNGNLLLAKTYNDGSSNYPKISKAKDGTIFMSGFSNLYANPVGFQTLILKMDTTYSTGCFENDVLPTTIVSSIPFKITLPTKVIGQNATITDDTATWVSSIIDTTFCEAYPMLVGTINSQGYCFNDTTHFNIDTTNLTYWHWDFGDMNSLNDTSVLANTSYQYPSAGNYSVQLIVSNGCETDTFYQAITIANPINNFSISNDTLICLGDSIQITANLSGLNYSWNTNQTTQNIYIKNAGTYYCSVNTVCGIISDTMKLTTKSCIPDAINHINKSDCLVIIPSAFSPNGDGHNDVLKPIIVGNQNQDFKFEQLTIINRWGNIVFTSNDAKIGWDGTYKGSIQPTENYFYFVRYHCNGKEKAMKGNVVIVR